MIAAAPSVGSRHSGDRLRAYQLRLVHSDNPVEMLVGTDHRSNWEREQPWHLRLRFWWMRQWQRFQNWRDLRGPVAKRLRAYQADRATHPQFGKATDWRAFHEANRDRPWVADLIAYREQQIARNRQLEADEWAQRLGEQGEL